MCSIFIFTLVGCSKKPFSTELKELINDDKANISTADIVDVFERYNEYKEISKSAVDLLNDRKEDIVGKEGGFTQEEYDQLKTFYTDFGVMLNAFTSYDINKIKVEFYGEEPSSVPSSSTEKDSKDTATDSSSEGKDATPESSGEEKDLNAESSSNEEEDIPYVLVYHFEAIPEELKSVNYETINSVMGDMAAIQKYDISGTRVMFLQKENYLIEIHGRYCDFFDGIRNILDQRVK